MSKFIEFYSHILESDDRKTKLEQICASFPPDGEPEPLLNALIEFAGQEGFDFTLEEVKDYFARVEEGGELLEEELEAVAGGKSKYGGCVIIGVDDRKGACIVYGNICDKGGCIGIGYYAS